MGLTFGNLDHLTLLPVISSFGVRQECCVYATTDYHFARWIRAAVATATLYLLNVTEIEQT
jgi:hypothetical protein